VLSNPSRRRTPAYHPLRPALSDLGFPPTVPLTHVAIPAARIPLPVLASWRRSRFHGRQVSCARVCQRSQGRTNERPCVCVCVCVRDHKGRTVCVCADLIRFRVGRLYCCAFVRARMAMLIPARLAHPLHRHRPHRPSVLHLSSDEPMLRLVWCSSGRAALHVTRPPRPAPRPTPRHHLTCGALQVSEVRSSTNTSASARRPPSSPPNTHTWSPMSVAWGRQRRHAARGFVQSNTQIDTANLGVLPCHLTRKCAPPWVLESANPPSAEPVS
jgi:hypothetical protein